MTEAYFTNTDTQEMITIDSVIISEIEKQKLSIQFLYQSEQALKLKSWMQRIGNNNPPTIELDYNHITYIGAFGKWNFTEPINRFEFGYLNKHDN